MRFPEKAINAAAYIFEKANGNKLAGFEVAEIDHYGLSEVHPELIVKELMIVVAEDHKTNSSYREKVYWALGKRFESKLIPFFRERLSLELQRNLIAVYQILIALDNLEESVFSLDRNGSVGMHEYDLNRKDAVDYLNSKN